MDDRPVWAPWVAKNGGPFQLCRCKSESEAHILFLCRYLLMIWDMVRDWLGLVNPRVDRWSGSLPVKDWWSFISTRREACWRATPLLAMLVSREIWNKHTARVFKNSSYMPSYLLKKIREEAFGHSYVTWVGFYFMAWFSYARACWNLLVLNPFFNRWSKLCAFISKKESSN